MKAVPAFLLIAIVAITRVAGQQSEWEISRIRTMSNPSSEASSSSSPVVTRLNCFTRPSSKLSMVCRQWRDSNRPELQKVVTNAARDPLGKLVPGVPVELTIQDCHVSEIPEKFLASAYLESLTISGCLAGATFLVTEHDLFELTMRISNSFLK